MIFLDSSLLRLKVLKISSTITWVKSLPPKLFNPSLFITSKNKSVFCNIVKSIVPPPVSITKIISSKLDEWFKPYARAAALGSFIILITLNPTDINAAFIISRCESLKFEGTVITAFIIQFVSDNLRFL